MRQKATGFSPAPGAQRRTPCRPQQASSQRHRAQSPDKGIFAVCEAESELESVTYIYYIGLTQREKTKRPSKKHISNIYSHIYIIPGSRDSRYNIVLYSHSRRERPEGTRGTASQTGLASSTSSAHDTDNVLRYSHDRRETPEGTSGTASHTGPVA